jgi:hypothetical protein
VLRGVLPACALVFCFVWFEAASAEPHAQAHLEIAAARDIDPSSFGPGIDAPRTMFPMRRCVPSGWTTTM